MALEGVSKAVHIVGVGRLLCCSCAHRLGEDAHQDLPDEGHAGADRAGEAFDRGPPDDVEEILGWVLRAGDVGDVPQSDAADDGYPVERSVRHSLIMV